MTEICKPATFIEEYYVSADLCKKIINSFEEKSNFHNQGPIGLNGIDSSKKDSTDCMLEDLDEFYYLYIAELLPILRKYYEKYEIRSGEFYFGSATNVQRYYPNQGYFVKHVERCAASLETVRRGLVFMTYLNTLNSENGAGGTAFPMQNIITTPVEGKTIVWPAEFTHPHHGITHTLETKYIVTGWLHYRNFS